VSLYNVDENLTHILLTAMHTLFYVSFALGLVTAGLDYNTVLSKSASYRAVSGNPTNTTFLGTTRVYAQADLNQLCRFVRLTTEPNRQKDRHTQTRYVTTSVAITRIYTVSQKNKTPNSWP